MVELSDAGALTRRASDVTSRRHGTSRRRTSAGGATVDATADVDDRPRFVVSVDDEPPITRRLSVRSRRTAAASARPPTPPPPEPSTSTDEPLDAGSHVVQQSDSGEATARRRMSAAERRRLKAELLSSSSLEVSYVSQCSIVAIISSSLSYGRPIFLPCGFYLLSSFFPRLISAVADWMSTILPHMLWT